MSKITKKSGQFWKKLDRYSKKAGEATKEHIKENIVQKTDSIKLTRLWVLEWVLLVSLLILTAVLQILWYNNLHQTTAFVAGGSFTEGSIGRINSLNPLYASTNSEKVVARLLFPRLISVDTSGSLKNELVESIRPDATGKIWTAQIREGLSWSDGEKIDASDVIYTFELIQNPRAKTAFAGLFTNVKVEQIDEYQVKFTLPSAYNAFPMTLDLPIVPKHILENVAIDMLHESSFSKAPIGYGPFVFESINAMGISGDQQVVVLERNENFKGGAPRLESFILHTYQDKENLDKALRALVITGTADLNNYERLAPSDNIYERESVINNGTFIYLNCESEFLASKDVRNLIRKGLDRQTILETISEQNLIDYPILKSQISLKFPEIQKYDKAAAEAGLKKIIGDEEAPILSIAVVDTPPFKKIAEMVSEQLNELGLETNIISASATDLVSSIIRYREYDILIYETVLGVDPDPFAYYHSSQISETGLNFSNYSNPLVDDSLLAARTTMDAKLQISKYETFLKYWNEESPSIPLYQTTTSYFYNKNSRVFSEDTRLISPLDRFSDVIYWSNKKESVLKTP
jgi:peptide/nickel transport system substrate-binding protein